MPPTENVFSKERVDERVAYETRPEETQSDPGRPRLRHPRETRADPVETLFSLSRRHDLPFGVLVVRVRGRVDGARGAVLQGAPTSRLWRLVDREIRQTDLVAAWEPDGAIVFCPATPPEGTKELAQRLLKGAGDLRVGVGTASFRTDGFTLADLVARASESEIASHAAPGDDAPPAGGLRLLARGARPRSPFDRAIKRLFDLFVVAISSPLWLPLTAIVAALVKLSDPRAPIFFVQARTGRGGRRFRMYKFRTMVPDAERLKGELRQHNERSWPDFKIEADPRITRLGRWLRASSLDELPQIWNVLRGDMSLVGPRPTSFPADTYASWQTARLEATPGLTGLWQVEARNCPDFSERIRLDVRYVESQGFLYDLKILLRTLPAVLWDREGR